MSYESEADYQASLAEDPPPEDDGPGGNDLRPALIEFARGLVAEEIWCDSSSYEPTVKTRIREAVACCKADIGRALLRALGAE